MPMRYIIVLLAFLCACICYIERVGFSIAYTASADAAGVNQSTKGLILSTFFYGYAFSQVPGGWVAQCIGGRRVLLFFFLLWPLICALIPLDPHLMWTLVVARFFIGIAQGVIFPSIHAVWSQWIPLHERTRSVSVTTSGMYLGASVGMLFVPNLILFKGPQSIFFVEAALGALWSLLCLKLSSESPRTDNQIGLVRAPRIPWRSIFLSLPIGTIAVNNFAFHYALYVLMNWLPTYFEQALQLSHL